jgi:Sec-independent protein secretion pathway component TatC
MMMSVGVVELAVVLIVLVVAGLLFALRRDWRVLAYPLFFALAAIATPAEPLSMLLVAVPSSCIYLLATRSRGALAP